MVLGAGKSKWNYGMKKTKQARTVGSPFFSGSNWRQEEKNRRAEEKKARRKAKRGK